jgi:uncharacterized protein
MIYYLQRHLFHPYLYYFLFCFDVTVQLPYVDSTFIMPAVIYIGGKLRHPFRLYTNDEGNICVLVCEASIIAMGICSVLDAVVKWASNNGVKEVIVLEGIPVADMPDPNRKPIILSSDGEADDEGYLRYVDNKKKGSLEAAFIAGISGGLLSSCLSNGIACRALLITASSGIPDPEGIVSG